MAWWRNKAVIVSLAIVVCAGGTYAFLANGKKTKAADAKEIVVEAKKGDIRFSVSGTSQFEAKDMQTISAPADGILKTMNLTRNMNVKTGDVLFALSSSTLENNLQKAHLTYDQLQRDLNDLQIQQGSLKATAPISGKIVYADKIDVGLAVTKTSKIGTISDINNLMIILPFQLEDAVQMHNGDPIDLTLDGFMLTKTGTVSSVGKDPRGDGKGGKLIDVTVAISNDNTLDAGLKARGSATIGNRSVDSSDAGTLQYSKVVNILSNVGGNIDALPLKSGDMVKAGALVASFVNDTIGNDIASKQAALDQQKSVLDDAKDKVAALTVTAPFDGVFSTDFANKKANVLSNFAVGAKVPSGTQFGGIASLDTMQLPVQVDELDLPNIKTGMKAEVKVDSVPGRIFPAEVTQVSTVGTTTNGVTFFDVVLAVKNANNQLKYGMTATGEILIQDKKGVVYLPPEGLQSQRNKRFVSLKKEDGTVENEHEVKIGIRSKTQVEITEGLKEGDKVIIPVATKQQNLSQQEINNLRQQFQQGGGAGGGNLSQQQIDALRQQFQQGGGAGGAGGNGGAGGTNGNAGNGGNGGANTRNNGGGNNGGGNANR